VSRCSEPTRRESRPAAAQEKGCGSSEDYPRVKNRFSNWCLTCRLSLSPFTALRKNSVIITRHTASIFQKCRNFVTVFLHLKKTIIILQSGTEGEVFLPFPMQPKIATL